MHGQCTEQDCPVCVNGTYQDADKWLKSKLKVVLSGLPKSPWWEVEESNGDCYRKLRGDLRKPGFYDFNPTT